MRAPRGQRKAANAERGVHRDHLRDGRAVALARVEPLRALCTDRPERPRDAINDREEGTNENSCILYSRRGRNAVATRLQRGKCRFGCRVRLRVSGSVRVRVQRLCRTAGCNRKAGSHYTAVPFSALVRPTAGCGAGGRQRGASTGRVLEYSRRMGGAGGRQRGASTGSLIDALHCRHGRHASDRARAA